MVFDDLMFYQTTLHESYWLDMFDILFLDNPYVDRNKNHIY